MLTIELPEQAEQTAVNERRWAELLSDPELAKIEGRIETTRHGEIIISPPPAARHGRFQSRILLLLEKLMPPDTGEVMAVCPISTADGVRVPDAAWYSKSVLAELGNRVCFPKAPEICVEVLSPDNSDREIREKAALYFDAVAGEVWICDRNGKMRFMESVDKPLLKASKLCPGFPTEIKLD